MRELEFLPPWYHVLRRKKRHLKLQLTLTLVIFCGLCLWSLLAARNVRTAEGALRSLRSQVSQTETELTRLAELERLRQEWRQQDQIIAKLGVSIESTRLISTIEQLMPREMSLLDFSMETKEQPRQIDSFAKVRAALTDQQEQIDRMLQIKLHGVAPTDSDVAAFHTRLCEVSFFNNVAMSFVRDRPAKGYLMREFEISFTLNINAAGAN